MHIELIPPIVNQIQSCNVKVKFMCFTWFTYILLKGTITVVVLGADVVVLGADVALTAADSNIKEVTQK